MITSDIFHPPLAGGTVPRPWFKYIRPSEGVHGKVRKKKGPKRPQLYWRISAIFHGEEDFLGFFFPRVKVKAVRLGRDKGFEGGARSEAMRKPI
jgi:hypothetical protein